jgi:periplasmic protein CpxP/Spy
MSLQRAILPLFLVFSVCTNAVPALAQPSDSQGPPRKDKERGLLPELNLTPDQVQRVRSVRERYKEQIREASERFRQARQELSQLMGSGNASDAQIRDKFRQVQTAEQQLSQLRFESTLAVRAVLNPEQRRQFATQMENKRQRQRPERKAPTGQQL